ncbi:MAG: IS4 family transposase [Gammaproteobacteria bacterium]|nr:IS4 family transposase [Gammaproteobacteria bacterium]
MYTVLMQTPFFPPWRAQLGSLRPTRQRVCSQPLPAIQKLFGPWIATTALVQEDRGLNSRERIFSIRLTFWAFLAQMLNPGSPCREAVRQVLALFSLHGCAGLDEQTSAYCQARLRLPRQRLQQILGQTAALARQRCPKPRWVHGEVKVVDGSTVTMPDTAANQKRYPQQKAQQPGCGFPIMKFVGLFSLATGCLLTIVTGNYYVAELRLFRGLWHYLKAGDLLLADRIFGDYATFAALGERGVDCLTRLHQGRKADFRQGDWLGRYDRLITWTKPVQRTGTIGRRLWSRLPQELTLRMICLHVTARGFRTRKLVLITTLLDPAQYPATEIGRLYLQRWQVELFFRDIKTILQMEHLRCKTPAMVEKEFLMHLIGYNLVRCVMLEAARAAQAPLERISFKGAVDSVRQYCPAITQARSGKKRRLLVRELLRVLAADLVPERPGRREPRVLKRRRKPYALLNRPRHQFVEWRHRNRSWPGKTHTTRKP